MKKKIKNSKERGITLIALVVTIIIMLILAGVALTMALGDNGLIKQAKFAKSEYEKAAKSEGNIVSNGGIIYEYLYDVDRYQTDNLILLLDGKMNTKEGHNNATDTWYDISGVSGKNATKVKGTSQWSEKSLKLDRKTTYTVDAPVDDSFGTVEVCVKIDKNFTPNKISNWFQCSTIFGCELPNPQKDWAIIIDENGNFAIGYNWGTIYSSNVSALDGKIHTITYSYLLEKLIFAVDGQIITTIEDFTPGGSPCTAFGVGWNNATHTGYDTAIQGEIYCVRFYKGELTEQDIEKNYEADKKSFE